MKLSLILEAIDRMSRPVGAARAATRGLGTETVRAAGGVSRLGNDVGGLAPRMRTAAGSTRQYGASSSAAAAGVGRLGSGVDRLGSRIGALIHGPAGLKALERASHGAGNALGTVARKVGGLAATGAGFGAAGLAGLSSYLTFGVIRTGAEFEVFQSQLQQAEGSADKARRAMAWVRTFAKDTPYELAEVTEAFVKARKGGIDPYGKAMMTIADASGGANKSLVETVEALKDAQNGQFERLLEYNITASTKGDAVTFRYIDRAGKAAMRTVKRDQLELQRGVLGIYDAMYKGGSELRSRTLPGIMSNLKDAFTGFQFDIASAGFYDKVKAKLESILTTINRMSADGSLARWAKVISDRLSEMTDRAWAFVTTVDWAETAQTVSGVAKAFWAVATAIAKAVEWAEKLNSLGNALDRRFGFDNGDRSLESRAWSLMQWDPVGDWMNKRLSGESEKSASPRRGPASPVSPPRLAPPASPVRRMAPPARTVVPTAQRSRQATGPEGQHGSARVDLRITTDRHVQVTKTRVQAKGMELSVNTGTAMGHFA